MPCLHQRDGNVKMYATPTESVFSTLNRARGSLDLGTYKWTLLLNQRLKPQLQLSCSQEETVEEVNSVSKGGVGSSCEGEWGRIRGGNILCSWRQKKNHKNMYIYLCFSSVGYWEDTIFFSSNNSSADLQQDRLRMHGSGSGRAPGILTSFLFGFTCLIFENMS